MRAARVNKNSKFAGLTAKQCAETNLISKIMRTVTRFKKKLHYKYNTKCNWCHIKACFNFQILNNYFQSHWFKNILARVHPDALCLKPGLVDALGGADQQSVQRCRRSRSSGPSGRHVPGQQRQQHQQPLYGRLWWTSVPGRTVFKKLPERPVWLRLKEDLKDECQKCSCTTTYLKTLTWSRHFTQWRKHSRSLWNRNVRPSKAVPTFSFIAFC